MTFVDILRAQLRTDEGYRTFPYMDSVGKVTIGVGHNLSAKGVSDALVSQWLDEDIADAVSTARELLQDFDQLSDARKAVICNMAFQLGGAGLAEFQNTLRNIRDGRWDDAATAMLQSKVAKTQAPARWKRLADQMRSDSA